MLSKEIRDFFSSSSKPNVLLPAFFFVTVLSATTLSVVNNFLFIKELSTAFLIIGMLFLMRRKKGSGKKIISYERFRTANTGSVVESSSGIFRGTREVRLKVIKS